MDFYNWLENIKSYYWIQDQMLSKIVHKAGKYLENKIADAITKSNNDNEKQKPVEERIIPPEKRKEILNKSKKGILQK